MEATATLQKSELWELLSRGDGDSCPMFRTCTARLSGEWCLSENLDLMYQRRQNRNLLCDPDDEELGEFQELFRPYFPFSKPWQSSPVMHLVESLADNCIDITRADYVPIDQDVIQKLGIRPPLEIRLIPMAAHHGAAWRLSDAWVIHLNSHDHPVRQRWTLFHELFHVIATTANPGIVFKKHAADDVRFNEFVADYFATCVLVPGRNLSVYWDAARHSLTGVAQVFQVPEVAAWIRLKTLNLI